MLPRHWFRRSAPPAQASPTTEATQKRMPSSLPGWPQIKVGHGTNLFDAAAGDRLTSGWVTTPETADDTVYKHRMKLVARSREQASNNDYAIRYLQMARQNIVGPHGIQLQAQPLDYSGKRDNLAADAIEAAWWLWGRKGNCDITGTMSWRAVQEACVNAAAMDGEFFIRLLRGSSAGPMGFAVQMIDSVRCPVDYSVERPAEGGGNFIRMGIEYTPFGRPVAYHFESTDETEDSYRFGGRTLIRVPAEEILHGFKPIFVGQKRGLPWLSTALFRLRMIGQYEDATLVNARIAASKGGFFEWDEGYGPEALEDDDIEMEVAPGTFRELPRGVKFREFSPQFPHGEYAIFHKAQLRGIASGLGVAYNGLANDLTDVNFSSIRQGALDERDNWKVLQEWLVEVLLEPVYMAWLQRALLAEQIKIMGKPLPASRIDKYAAVEWQPRRWQWVDPRADSEANIKAKNNLLMSPSAIIREQGRDPEAVWREVAADIERMKAAGIPDEFIKAAINDQMGKQNTQGTGNGNPNS